MIIGRKSCSRSLSQRRRLCWLKLRGAKTRAVAVRELGSASLLIWEWPTRRMRAKPTSEREETTEGTDRTPRGERRQRVSKEPARTWETRFGVAGQPLTGSHNRQWGQIAESDGLIVAVKSWLSREGAKEPWPESRRVRGDWS